MARNRFTFKKRQKELARIKKKEEKMKRRAEKLKIRIENEEDVSNDSSDQKE